MFERFERIEVDNHCIIANRFSKYYWNPSLATPAWTPVNLGNTGGTASIFPSGGLASIVGTLNSLGQPVIYGIVGPQKTDSTNGLVAITDKSTYNTTMVAANVDIAYLAKAGVNYAFRGVAFSPSQYTLPINLVSFNGSLVNGKTALQWTTASEINAKEFIVEKSNNSIDYSEIGTVASKNAAGTSSSYAFDDAALKNGLNYYRLKMVDKDGSFQYSNVVVIKLDVKPSTALSVFPNPVSNAITLSHSEAGAGAIVSIFALNGKLVSTKAVAKSATQTSFDVSALPAGAYVLVFDNNGSKSTINFIK